MGRLDIKKWNCWCGPFSLLVSAPNAQPLPHAWAWARCQAEPPPTHVRSSGGDGPGAQAPSSCPLLQEASPNHSRLWSAGWHNLCVSPPGFRALRGQGLCSLLTAVSWPGAHPQTGEKPGEAEVEFEPRPYSVQGSCSHQRSRRG